MSSVKQHLNISNLNFKNESRSQQVIFEWTLSKTGHTKDKVALRCIGGTATGPFHANAPAENQVKKNTTKNK